jgi:hypothetical protein
MSWMSGFPHRTIGNQIEGLAPMFLLAMLLWFAFFGHGERQCPKLGKLLSTWLWKDQFPYTWGAVRGKCSWSCWKRVLELVPAQDKNYSFSVPSDTAATDHVTTVNSTVSSYLTQVRHSKIRCWPMYSVLAFLTWSQQNVWLVLIIVKSDDGYCLHWNTLMQPTHIRISDFWKW